jgi:predicted DNA-binding protein (MmcQ/YjbR family)
MLLDLLHCQVLGPVPIRTCGGNAVNPQASIERNIMSAVNLQQLKKLCAAFPGATGKASGEPSNVLVYYVGGKFFAYFKTSDPEKWRFSIRVTPDRFLELTGMPGIKPARYMGRFHWVTVVKIGSLPDDYLAELVEWSYRKAYTALSRKMQNEITAATKP